MARVLVVDDEADTRNVLKLLLTLNGHEVVTAGDGISALEAAREHRPDLVITDWMMPRMNGVQLCNALREDPQLQSLPIVVASAVNMDSRNLPPGLDRFLRKPFEAGELLDIVRTLTSKSGSRPED